MRQKQWGFGLVVLGLGLCAHLARGADDRGETGKRDEGKKPNILLIVADDLGYADPGFQGGKDVPTPHLDALAKTGVICSQGYVSGPYCSPTRAGLLTGRYQQRFGHEFNPGGQRNANNTKKSNKKSTPFGLPLTETTIANRLKSAGYATGLVGKWHLGDTKPYRPRQRGFDEFFGFLGGAHTYFTENSPTIYRNDEPTKESEYLTDAIGREAVSFIDRHKTHPFFLEVTFNAVHTPMQATDARLARFAHVTDPVRRKYAAMLSALDDAVGAIVKSLETAGLAENTLIVFISDNGGPTMQGTSVNGSRNDPLRGSKRTTLEGGIRVPFVVRWPGKLPAGKVYDAPVIQLDILPTALAAAGAAPTTQVALDGVNLLPFLNGENTAKPHDALYWRLGPQTAIRQGQWKLVRYDVAADQRAAGGRAGGGDGPKVTALRLYDLSQDIGESHDLSAQHPEKVKELNDAWEAWSRKLAKPLWGPGSQGNAANGARDRE